MTEPFRDQFHVRAHVDVLDCERVPEAMRAEGVREPLVLLRSFGQRVPFEMDPAAEDETYTVDFKLVKAAEKK